MAPRPGVIEAANTIIFTAQVYWEVEDCERMGSLSGGCRVSVQKRGSSLCRNAAPALPPLRVEGIRFGSAQAATRLQVIVIVVTPTRERVLRNKIHVELMRATQTRVRAGGAIMRMFMTRS